MAEYVHPLDNLQVVPGSIRRFETGATRNLDHTEPDYEGFMSPLTILAFGAYMNHHRKQKDGSIRDSDNWQKGIPLDSYMKSMLRHVHDIWMEHRGFKSREGILKGLLGAKFNIDGYIHEYVKAHPGCIEETFKD